MEGLPFTHPVETMRYLLLACALLLLPGCDALLDLRCGGDRPADQLHRVSIREGVAGQVWHWEGDFMPGCPSGTIRGVERTIYLHELTRQDQTRHDGPVPTGFVTAIETAVVDSVRSDRRGFFQLRLPPGRYSLFVREGDRFYANGWDGEGFVKPIEVRAGVVARIQLDLTYGASF